MCYYTQYKCTFVHNVRINNVPKQYVRLLYTYNLNIEENEVDPDSRQVPILLVGQYYGGVMHPSLNPSKEDRPRHQKEDST